MRVASLNIQYGAGGIERVMGAVRDLEADVLFTQEVDRDARRSGHRDQFKLLAEAGGFPYSYYARTLRISPRMWGQFGIAAFVRTSTTALPPCFKTVDLSIEGDREPRVAIEVDLGGATPLLYGTHLSVDQGNAARQLSALLAHAREAAQAEDEARPWLITGDLNLTTSQVQKLLLGELDGTPLGYLATGDELTHPSWDPVRRIDHIITSSDATTSSVFGSAKFSDHLGVMTEI